jgi:hypothetical protein
MLMKSLDSSRSCHFTLEEGTGDCFGYATMWNGNSGGASCLGPSVTNSHSLGKLLRLFAMPCS